MIEIYLANLARKDSWRSSILEPSGDAWGSSGYWRSAFDAARILSGSVMEGGYRQWIRPEGEVKEWRVRESGL